MIVYEDARRLVLEALQTLPPVRVPLLEAAGMVSSGEVTAVWDLPSFDNSAMDGYAVRSFECRQATELPVMATLMAGDRISTEFSANVAIRIMTGAPIPPGFDAVIPFEDVINESEQSIKVPKGISSGQHIRFSGEDLKKGDPIVSRGTLIRVAEVSMLAACGITDVEVFRRPKVAILSTGDELVEFGQPMTSGKVINSNAVALSAAVTEAGGVPVLLGIAADAVDSLKEKISQGLAYDMLVTTAGVSAGERDLVREVLACEGVEPLFWKVAIKPGGPTAFGMKGGIPVFSLPGNPVSSIITFEYFARPALLKMMGYSELSRPVFKGILAEDITKKEGKAVVVRLRVKMDGEVYLLSSSGNQQTGFQKTLLNADALALLPPDSVGVKKGDMIEFSFLK